MPSLSDQLAPDAPVGSTATHFVGWAGLLSGVMLGLCFPPFDFWPLAWIALVPLGFVLSAPRMTRPAWAGVYLGGLAFHLLALDWLRTSYGTTGTSGPYFCGWLIAGQAGAGLLLLLLVAGRRFVRTTQLPMSWALPIVWVSFETVRQAVMSLVDGAGTPWFELAVTQVNFAPIAQVADLGGSAAIAFLVAAGNGILFDLLQRARHRRRWSCPSLFGVATAAGLGIVAFTYGSWRLHQTPTEHGPTCLLLGSADLPPLLLKERLLPDAGGQLPELFLWHEQAYHHKLVEVTRGTEPTEVALPPDIARLTRQDAAAYGQTVRRYLSQAARQWGAGILIGCDRLEADASEFRRYNSLAFADPTNGYQGCYDKRYLVPWSEFVPIDLTWLQVSNGIGSDGKGYEPGADVRIFTLTGKAKENRSYRIGTAICYDIAFAEHFRHLVQQGPIDFVAQSGSENRDNSGSQSLTLLRMAQLRAIEIRRAVVRNVHRGHSAVIDGNGRLVWVADRQPLDQPVRVPAVPLDKRGSLYVWLGDWPARGLLLLLIAGILPTARRSD